jgi:diacylglycerol kinase family enzyme
MSDRKLLVILKDSGSFKMLDETVNLKDGDYSEEDNIFYTQAKQVSIASRKGMLQSQSMVSLLTKYQS